ncbi:hypothetical protein BDY17DRAFT_347038 [Neohortaea acidophila]|uniref:Uncharacterized protein n=1 Tax=Neohortaea acidophila TaxID=245834 RepID=A0A6A6PP32_9PEZI|nr:uncharacterized protein BDY17DRAFT_347038 [Neohortaea acidophila]KAF2481772.1 hypothetical protein BDY17DRAFT_347038 [Neohortaea acidophila]
MPQLTSLPDELLFAIFSHCFRTVSSEASPVHPPSNPLSNYILTPRPYALAHEAFFATYIPVVHITPTSFEWDEGTLLHDLYSPVFSPRGSHRSALAVVAEVRKLRVVVRVEDERQVGTAIYETLREIPPSSAKGPFDNFFDYDTNRIQTGLSSSEGIKAVRQYAITIQGNSQTWKTDD